jgi:hypothetical protein
MWCDGAVGLETQETAYEMPFILPSRFCSLPSDAHESNHSEGVVVQKYRGSEEGIGRPGEVARGATNCVGEELDVFGRLENVRRAAGVTV